MANYICCDGARVYLDGSALAHGRAELEPGTIGEQCEGCGEELLAGASVHTASIGTSIECDECGAVYHVETEGSAL